MVPRVSIRDLDEVQEDYKADRKKKTLLRMGKLWCNSLDHACKSIGKGGINFLN